MVRDAAWVSGGTREGVQRDQEGRAADSRASLGCHTVPYWIPFGASITVATGALTF